jgi:hypothetical protein
VGRDILKVFVTFVLPDLLVQLNPARPRSRGALATTIIQSLHIMKQVLFFILLIQIIGCKNINDNKGGIPFEYNRSIILSAKINDSISAKFLFDTGSTWLILDSTFASKSGLTKLITKKSLMNGAGEDGLRHIGVINDTICYQVGVHKYYSKHTAVLNLKSTSGFTSDGVIGVGLLKNNLVKIDFVNKRIYLDSLKSLDLTNSMPFRFCHEGILIPIETVLENGKQINGDCLLDLGSQAALTFTNDFALKNNFSSSIDKKLKLVMLSSGLCGKSSVYNFRVKYVKIGNIKFHKPVLEYSLDTSGGLFRSKSFIGDVGIELLGRTIITIDFASKLIKIEPGSNVSDKFEISKTGLSYSKLKNDNSFKVMSIYDTVAIKSGLKLGDTIIKINNKSADLFTVDSIYRLNQSKEILFTILRNGREININLIPKKEI